MRIRVKETVTLPSWLIKLFFSMLVTILGSIIFLAFQAGSIVNTVNTMQGQDIPHLRGEIQELRNEVQGLEKKIP